MKQNVFVQRDPGFAKTKPKRVTCRKRVRKTRLDRCQSVRSAHLPRTLMTSGPQRPGNFCLAQRALGTNTSGREWQEAGSGQRDSLSLMRGAPDLGQSLKRPGLSHGSQTFMPPTSIGHWTRATFKCVTSGEAAFCNQVNPRMGRRLKVYHWEAHPASGQQALPPRAISGVRPVPPPAVLTLFLLSVCIFYH